MIAYAPKSVRAERKGSIQSDARSIIDSNNGFCRAVGVRAAGELERTVARIIITDARKTVGAERKGSIQSDGAGTVDNCNVFCRAILIGALREFQIVAGIVKIT